MLSGYKNDKTSLNEAEDKLKELMAKEDVQTIINDLGRVLLSEFDTFAQAEVRLGFG